MSAIGSHAATTQRSRPTFNSSRQEEALRQRAVREVAATIEASDSDEEELKG